MRNCLSTRVIFKNTTEEVSLVPSLLPWRHEPKQKQERSSPAAVAYQGPQGRDRRRPERTKMSDQEAKEPSAAAAAAPKKTCLFKRAVKRPGGAASRMRQRQRSPSKSGSSDSDSSDSSGETQVGFWAFLGGFFFATTTVFFIQEGSIFGWGSNFLENP